MADCPVVVGYKADHIRGGLGDGSGLGVRIRYVETLDVARGPGHELQLAREPFTGNFLTLLADEFYLGSNHREILAFPADGCDAARTSG